MILQGQVRLNLADRRRLRETPHPLKTWPQILLRKSWIPWTRIDHQTPRALKFKMSLWGESVMRSQPIDLAWETLTQNWYLTKNKKLEIPTVYFRRTLQSARRQMKNMDKLKKVKKKTRHHLLCLAIIRLTRNQMWLWSSFSKLRKQGFKARSQRKRLCWQAETTSLSK